MSAISSPPNTTNDPLTAALARWRATVDAELKGASFEKKFITHTPEGVALHPLYTRADLKGVPELASRPGEAPFLRGVRANGYKTGGWRVAQEIAATNAMEFNAALKNDLQGGQNAVVLAANGGVAMHSVDDFAAILAGVDLTAVPVYLHAGADAAPLASIYLEYTRSRNLTWSKLTGSLTADPLGEWAARGALPTALPQLYSSLADWTVWTGTYLPTLKTIGVNAALWADAGGTATQELAFALAAGVEYLRAMGERGLSGAEAASRMEFRLAAGPQFFTEIAKFRAFRPLWARVVSAFHAEPQVAARATVRASTCRWDKTLLDPHVNMLRVTTEALSAVLGGCDALHIAPFDEVTGATTEVSRRIARNVHTLLAEEFGFSEVADAAGGSWYVEKLTDELARKAWALFQDIEGRGGFAAALQAGYPQHLVEKSAADKREGVAKRRIGIVGTNLFPNLKETPFVRATLTAPAAPVSGKLPEPARGDWPTRFAAALSLAREGGTTDQVSALLSGAPVPEMNVEPVTTRRASADFEELRAASADFAKRTGARPKVFLAKMGPVAQHKARADFSAGFFATGGFEMIAKQSFETAEQAAEAAVKSGASIVVLCSTDDTYPVLVPAFAPAVKAANPKITVVLAGWPTDAAVITAYANAGVDEFIHIRANVHAMLAKFQKQIGVSA